MKHQKAFTAYLQRKNLAPTTINYYIDHTDQFFQYTQKEALQVNKKDVLQYLQYLKAHKHYENITRSNRLLALNHYFTFLYQTAHIAQNPCLLLKIRGTQQKTLHQIFTPEELTQLCDSYYQLFVKNFDTDCYASRLGGIPANQRQQTLVSRQRNYAILSLLLNQGTTTREIGQILWQDLDLTKATIKISSSKKSHERILPLQAEQIGLLMHYIQVIRPQILAYHTTESDQLFLSLPKLSKKNTSATSIRSLFKPLTRQVKTLDKRFVNFQQIRASRITHWLKTYGLRKTQYLAGHQHISSTEHYLPNDLRALTDDISTLHPFQ